MQYDFSLQEAVDVILHEDGWMQGNNFDKNTFLSYGRANNYFVLSNAGFRTDFMDDELSFYSYKFNKSKILVHRLFMFEFC